MAELADSAWISGFNLDDYYTVFRQPGILHHTNELWSYHTKQVDKDEFLYRAVRWMANLPRATRDSGDTALQCTVTAGSWYDADGTLRTVAEKNTNALTDDSLNYLYYPHNAASSAALVVNTTGFPSATTAPHIAIATILTSSGAYDPSDITDYRHRNLIQPVWALSDQIQRRAWSTIGPFTYPNIAAGLTNQDMNYGGYTEGVPMPRAGYLVAASVRLTEARSAGTVTFKPTINGTEITPTGLNLQIDDNPTQTQTATVAWGTSGYTFSAGDLLGMSITSDASWAPATADSVSNLMVAFSGS